MKTDTKYNHVPRWFEYISQLGASLLVDATGKLFRDYDYIRRLQSQPKQHENNHKATAAKRPNQLDYESEDDEVVAPEVRAKRYRQEAETRRRENNETRGILTQAQPLLTLEYLVSRLSIFDVTNPHDSVYALLGISKDTTPTAANKKLHVTDHTQAVLEMFTAKKQYKVDYEASYIDICKEFIEFCVSQNVHRDPSRALDVICRPFAVDVDQELLPSWIPRLSKASYGMDRGPGIDGLRMGRKNADSLVGLPNLTHRNYNAAETKRLDKKVFRFRKRVTPPKPTEQGNGKTGEAETSNQTISTQSTSASAVRQDKSQNGDIEAPPTTNGQTNGESHVPSQPSSPTTARASSESNKGKNGPQSIFSSTKDAQTVQTTNAKPTSTVLNSPLPSPQPTLDHFSLFVRGFVLDTIAELQPSSQSGSIPTAWAHFAGWEEMEDTPPEHFWRTLVADRGSDGKNPPVYYSRACQESFRKGNTTSGVVDTTGLIEHERNSVVAQFCRRVQAAIWNRALVKTKAGRLGLVAANVKAGDLVCILYGCSVPVILRPHGPKKIHEVENEMRWELKYLADYIGQSYKNHLARQKLFQEKRAEDKKIYEEWALKKRKQWKNDTAWTEQWKLVRAGLMRIHEFRAWVIKRESVYLKEAGEPDAAKLAIDSMRNYVHLLLPRIYEIATWAADSGESDENIMDQLRSANNDATCRESFRLTEDQKTLWDRFSQDDEWASWWKETNEAYRDDEGFVMWARVHKKPIGYPNELGEALREWRKKPAQVWTTEWAAVNSWFLSIDSFRAWLRERGKFYGPEEVLENKQKWETDDEWHRNWDKSRPEVESFNAWMTKKGLENPDLQESTAKEQRQRFEEWRKSWLSTHPEAAGPEMWEAEKNQWKNIGRELEQRRNEEDDKRKEKARKRDKEPFLERWRKGWRPEVVNWKEFETALLYGRHWLKLVKKRRQDHVKEQKKLWSETTARETRQLERANFQTRKKSAREMFLERREEQEELEISYPDLPTKTIPCNGGGTANGTGSSNGTSNGQTYAEPAATPAPPSDQDSSTDASDDKTGPGAARFGVSNGMPNEQAEAGVTATSSQPGEQGSSTDASAYNHGETGSEPKRRAVGATNPFHYGGGVPSQTFNPTVQDPSQVSHREIKSAIQRRRANKGAPFRQVSFPADHLTEKPRLQRSRTEVAVEQMEATLYAELDTVTFHSHGELRYWIQRKKDHLKSSWQITESIVNAHHARWERGTPRFLGDDGRFKVDYRPPSKGELEQREKQKLEREKATDDEEDETDDETDDGTEKGEGKGTTEEDVGQVEGVVKKEGQTVVVEKDEVGAEGDMENGEEVETSKPKRRKYPCNKRRQWLKKKEKAEYQRSVEANYARKTGKDGQWYYEMMGECYVHGMMDGEAMAHQNNEGISTTVFEIR
jgi:hypothetical protein